MKKLQQIQYKRIAGVAGLSTVAVGGWYRSYSAQ
jgi:hypothetical protein